MVKWKKYASLIFARGQMVHLARVERSRYVRDMQEGTQDYTRLKSVETIEKLLNNITEEEYNEILNRK